MRKAPKFALSAVLTAMAALAVSGCTQPDAAAQAPVTDPYVNTGSGGARYVGNLGNARAVLPGAPSAEGFAASVGDSVTFGVEQVALTDESRAQVGRQAAWLARNKDFRALIEGHADEQGTREFNLALGARRAASVQEYLIAQGIEPSRISTVSYGNERPLTACTTPTDEPCASRNRRAVTVVSPGAPVAAVSAAATLPPAAADAGV